MTKENQNIENYYAGDSLVLDVTVTDQSGAAKDLTGASIEWGLFPRGSDTAVLTKTTTGGGVAVTGAGVFEVTVDPGDTTGLEGLHYHEAEVTDGAGAVSTVTVGYIEIEKSRV